MHRKVFRTGNSLVVSLPRESLEFLQLGDGTEVNVELDRTAGQIIIRPVREAPYGVDQAFARQVAEFIEEYRPALEALAKE